MLSDLINRYLAASDTKEAHPLILIAIFVLDLLALHPVVDGNGRLARLMTTHLLLGCGYDVSRYVSIEQLIYETKGEYYGALRASQRGWHEAEHDVWPFVSYLCETLAGAYDDFETSMASSSAPVGSKQDQVRAYVLNQAPAAFRFRELERALPAISAPTIRLVSE